MSEVKITNIEFYKCKIENAEIIKGAIINTGVIRNPEKISFLSCSGDNEGISKLNQEFNRIATTEKYLEKKVAVGKQEELSSQPAFKGENVSNKLFSAPSSVICKDESSRILNKSSEKNAKNVAGMVQATGSGLFGNSNKSQNSGLFGGVKQTTTQNPSMFLNKPSSSGLFSQPQPSAKGGLFGISNESKSVTHGENKPPIGGIFGSSAESSITGIFSKPQPKTGSGLFGAKDVSSQSKLFGSQTQSTTGGGLFGRKEVPIPPSQPAKPVFSAGGSLFNAGGSGLVLNKSIFFNIWLYC